MPWFQREPRAIPHQILTNKPIGEAGAPSRENAWDERRIPGYGFLRGTSQYGLLHFGHTRGFPVCPALGTHRCPHRSHLNPSIFTVPIHSGNYLMIYEL